MGNSEVVRGYFGKSKDGGEMINENQTLMMELDENEDQKKEKKREGRRKGKMEARKKKLREE